MPGHLFGTTNGTTTLTGRRPNNNRHRANRNQRPTITSSNKGLKTRRNGAIHYNGVVLKIIWGRTNTYRRNNRVGTRTLRGVRSGHATTSNANRRGCPRATTFINATTTRRRRHRRRRQHNDRNLQMNRRTRANTSTTHHSPPRATMLPQTKHMMTMRGRRHHRHGIRLLTSMIQPRGPLKHRNRRNRHRRVNTTPPRNPTRTTMGPSNRHRLSDRRDTTRGRRRTNNHTHSNNGRTSRRDKQRNNRLIQLPRQMGRPIATRGTRTRKRNMLLISLRPRRRYTSRHNRHRRTRRNGSSFFGYQFFNVTRESFLGSVQQHDDISHTDRE